MLSYIMSGLAVTKTVERILQLKRSPRELCHVDTQHQQRLDMPCLISLFKSKVQCCWVQILLSSSRFEWAHVDLHSKYSYHATQHQAAQMTVCLACWRKACICWTWWGPSRWVNSSNLCLYKILLQFLPMAPEPSPEGAGINSWHGSVQRVCVHCALQNFKHSYQYVIMSWAASGYRGSRHDCR